MSDPAPGMVEDTGVPLWFDVTVWDSVTNETWTSNSALMGDLGKATLGNAINDAVMVAGTEEPGSWVIASVMTRPNNPHEYTIITRSKRGDTSVINATLISDEGPE